MFWKALQYFSYSDPLLYEGLEVQEHGQTSCTINVMVPANVLCKPNWEAWTVSITGSSLEESWNIAVVCALTQFCEDHKEDVAGTPYAYLPIRDQSDEIWRSRVDSLFDWGTPTYNPTAAALMSYSAMMYPMFSGQKVDATESRGALRNTRCRDHK